MKRKTERNIFHAEIVERPVRKAVHFPAYLTAEDQQYSGFIMNISSAGVGMYIDTDFPENTISCSKGSILRLEFKSDLGEVIPLQCRICWLRIQERPPHGVTTSMGMEVVNPPSSFVNLYNRLL